MTNEHDITKMMLETMRLKTSKHKNLIRENEEMSTPDATVIGNNIEVDSETEEMGAKVDTEQEGNKGIESSSQVSNQEINEEERKFMDIVTPRVSFTSFKVYPDAANVVFNGKFDSGIEWQMSKVDGIFLNAPNIELDDEVLTLLKKLNGYYENWSLEWSKKLNTEYKKSDEE
jgi:hypothetical protein